MLSAITSHLARVCALIAATTVIAMAQNSNGYVFFAPGGISCCGQTTMTLHLGAGGEAVLAKGVGFGAEIGALGTRKYYSDSVFGVLSPNGYYHFLHDKDSRLDPFVTGGYSLFFRSGHGNFANFGGGINCWFNKRLGARLELRDHINTTNTIGHFWGVRFGLAFR
jgi:hypothetical protein